MISYPNMVPELSAIGRTIPGIADQNTVFTKGENITPFNDESVIEDPNENLRMKKKNDLLIYI